MSRFRVLFLAANPVTTTRLALDEEVHTIQQRLRTSGATDRVELCAEWALRAEELPVALMRHKPGVVHFSGHGSETGELLFISNQSGESPTPVLPGTLCRLFQALAGSVQCVVLNACYSLIHAQSLTAILPCVVGMNRAVEDKAAIAFAAGFYEALAFGRSIKTSFKLGCSQIELAQYISQSDIPELLFRSDIDAERFHIFEHNQNRKQRAHNRNTQNRSILSQIRIQKSNLEKLLIKRAKYGPLDVPLNIENQIDDIQQEIKLLERKLLSSGVSK